MTGPRSLPAEAALEPPSLPDDPVLNPEVVVALASLAAGPHVALLDQLATLFREDAPVYLEAMADALASADTASLTRSAHAMAGLSANLGAQGLWRLCLELETLADSGRRDECAAVLGLVAVQMDRVATAVGKWVTRP